MEFQEIYELYFKDVHLFTTSLCNDRSLAEEITQETFFKALKSIHQFDGSKDIRAWLFTIAKNTYFSYHKKNKRLTTYDTEVYENVPTAGVTLLEHFANEEDAFIIHQFIHKMDEPYKEVFSLRVFGELPFEKIGALFGKSAGWARVTYHRARKKISTYMEAIQDDKS